MTKFGHSLAPAALLISISVQAAFSTELELQNIGIGQRNTGVGMTAGIRIQLGSSHLVKEIERVKLDIPVEASVPYVMPVFQPVATLATSNAKKLDGITLGLLDHRRTPNLYWWIDASGKGVIRTPESTGYEVAGPLIVDPVFEIAPGEHRFDIGPAGYKELRTRLALLIENEPDSLKLTDGNCLNSTTMRSGTVDLKWSGLANGEYSLPRDCLNSLGQFYHDQMVRTWHIVARLMHAGGNRAVTIKEQLTMPVPKRLNFTMTNSWNGATSWSIGKTGKGWIEFSDGRVLPTLDISQPTSVGPGRYTFQLDGNFHQGVLRELDPYLTGPTQRGSCDDGIIVSDQPMFHLKWTYRANRSVSYDDTSGCSLVAARFQKVELAFAELIGKGKYGESKILSVR